jgi:glycosyltransferase involved in cell wall biosynthesis
MLHVHQGGSPVVSVILATYNRAQYLPRSIQSFQSQNLENTELLLVDDGSEDDTFQVLQQYMKHDARIRYLRHSNRKLSLSRNAGIKAAAGKYIAFLDSDDAYLPDYLSTRWQYLEERSEIWLLQGRAKVIGNPFVPDKNDRSKKIHLSKCTVGATFFGKKEVFETVGGFNESICYSEDSEFWERASSKIPTAQIDHEGYLYYRDTAGSICNSVIN